MRYLAAYSASLTFTSAIEVSLTGRCAMMTLRGALGQRQRSSSSQLGRRSRQLKRRKSVHLGQQEGLTMPCCARCVRGGTTRMGAEEEHVGTGFLPARPADGLRNVSPQSHCFGKAQWICITKSYSDQTFMVFIPRPIYDPPARGRRPPQLETPACKEAEVEVGVEVCCT